MALAVLVFTLLVVILYVALDIVIPNGLRKRRKPPDGDIARERENH